MTKRRVTWEKVIQWVIVTVFLGFSVPVLWGVYTIRNQRAAMRQRYSVPLVQPAPPVTAVRAPGGKEKP